MTPEETQALREMVLHAQVMAEQVRTSLRRSGDQLAQVEHMLALILTRLPDEASSPEGAPGDGPAQPP
jgi:hypothetical protein